MAEQDELARAILAAVRSVTGPGPQALHRPFINRLDMRCVADADPVGYGEIDRFERQLAEACGVARAVAVSSGTAALHLALLSAGVGPGDFVAMPSCTFAAGAAAIRYCGGVPAFGHTAETLGRSVKAAIAVDLLGQPDHALARRKARPMTIEDAAEALGSKLNGRPCGGLADIGVLSFNTNKIVTTGGGGALLTDDPQIAKEARHLATTAKVASPFFFDHTAVGFNYRMTNLGAALGLSQLKRLGETIKRKRETAAKYRRALAGIATTLEEAGGASSNYWLSAIEVPPGARDVVLETLRADGIEARALFTPLHTQRPYRAFPVESGEARAADARFAVTVCLPSGRMD